MSDETNAENVTEVILNIDGGGGKTLRGARRCRNWTHGPRCMNELNEFLFHEPTIIGMVGTGADTTFRSSQPAPPLRL